MMPLPATPALAVAAWEWTPFGAVPLPAFLLLTVALLRSNLRGTAPRDALDPRARPRSS